MSLLAKVSKFASIRNASGLQTNLQFLFDMKEAGLTKDDLGDPTKVEEGWYEWTLGGGRIKLIEKYGVMTYEVTP